MTTITATITATATSRASATRLHEDRPAQAAVSELDRSTPGPPGLRDLNDAVAAARDAIPCQGTDLELWFAESPADVEFAKSMCGTCPVRRTCLDGALQRREPCGVWGGELFIQGQIVARKRPRGRPRKDAAA